MEKKKKVGSDTVIKKARQMGFAETVGDIVEKVKEAGELWERPIVAPTGIRGRKMREFIGEVPPPCIVTDEKAPTILPKKKRKSRKKKAVNPVGTVDVMTLYFDKDAIQDSGIKLKRYDAGRTRKYYTVNEETQNVKGIYDSNTSFVHATHPKGESMLGWMKRLSPEQQKHILRVSSAYGTVMDILFNELIISGQIVSVELTLKNYLLQNSVGYVDAPHWIERLKRDCLAFSAFITEYEVRPIMVSAPLCSDSLRLAGTLDLLCEMNSRLPTKTIKPDRIIALVDYKSKIGDPSETKSSRGSFYDEECCQLLIYRSLILQNINIQLPKGQDDIALFNISPKDWLTTPSYNLKRWDGTKACEIEDRKIPHYLELFNITRESQSGSITVIPDSINLSTVPLELTLEQFLNYKGGKQ